MYNILNNWVKLRKFKYSSSNDQKPLKHLTYWELNIANIKKKILI